MEAEKKTKEKTLSDLNDESVRQFAKGGRGRNGRQEPRAWRKAWRITRVIKGEWRRRISIMNFLCYAFDL